MKRGSTHPVDTCESQQSYFEISHCKCDIISSSCSRSIECSLFLCGSPTLSSLRLYHYFKIGNLTSMCLVVQSEPVLCSLMRGSWEKEDTEYLVCLWICRLHREYESEVIVSVLKLFYKLSFGRIKSIFCSDFSLSRVFTSVVDS